jgi:hypothetical protein
MVEEIEFTGVVRGRRVIELDDELPLPDGSLVRLRLLPGNGAGQTADEEAASEAEAAKTLQAIYRMRHQGRSIQKP